jgi:hypothetical protein
MPIRSTLAELPSPTHGADFFRRIAVRAGLTELQTTTATQPLPNPRFWFPSPFQTIGPHLFRSMTRLRQLEFDVGSRLQRIKADAFKDGCLTHILIPPSVEVICESPFCNCTALQWIGLESGGFSLRIEAYAFQSLDCGVSFSTDLSFFWATAALTSAHSLSLIVFAVGSRIARIFLGCFARCALAAVITPAFRSHPLSLRRMLFSSELRSVPSRLRLGLKLRFPLSLHSGLDRSFRRRHFSGFEGKSLRIYLGRP